ncbi:MAG: NADP-reducing hydrogenase subunit HndC [Firmicutes bacterium]|nr:NADP-reducing hydrogenase subunit HndC [candidate division NPL-UPA2 bacterium]
MLTNVTINGRTIAVRPGSTILSACRQADIKVPTLCHHPDQAVKAACRICVVEVAGQRLLQPACSYPVSEGMVVNTATPAVREARRTMLELLLSNHPADCLQCPRSFACELQQLASELNVRETPFESRLRQLKQDQSTVSLQRIPDKCVNCRRCVHACLTTQGIGLLYTAGRGRDTVVQTSGNVPLHDVACVLCGQCLQACPVGAITEVDETEKVWDALSDPAKHVVVQVAPAIRVALGEEFGGEAGSVVTGKLVSALRLLGFDRVFDTDFTADLTIIEEGHEFLHRLSHGGTLPMITSCSPGWVKFTEHNYPEELAHLSSCKSPQQMFGALAKTYYAEQSGIEASSVFVVSVMPCTAKKFEAARPEMTSSGYRDVDVVLSTRELARMLKQAGIDWAGVSDGEFDAPLGISTGAAAIFGATGGVMEAALRTVYEVVSGKELGSLDFHAVRGMAGVKEAAIQIGDLVVNVGVAHGLANARQLMEQVANGTSPYHFIEIMCCPGGCIGGGGQPIPTTNAVREQRIRAIYSVDEAMTLRKSHQNPAVAKLYADFLKRPLGHKSHTLLHTEYVKRG